MFANSSQLDHLHAHFQSKKPEGIPQVVTRNAEVVGFSNLSVSMLLDPGQYELTVTGQAEVLESRRFTLQPTQLMT